MSHVIQTTYNLVIHAHDRIEPVTIKGFKSESDIKTWFHVLESLSKDPTKDKIRTIKFVRAQLDCGLLEAKLLVEEAWGYNEGEI